VPNSAGRCFETDAGYPVEVSRKLDILVAPQSVLEPLGLTKARNAVRNSPNLSAHSPSSAQEAPRPLTTAQTQSVFLGAREHWANGSAWLERMSETAGAAPDHGVVDGAPSMPPPLAATVSAPRLSPAEEARTIVAATNVAGLATVTADGDPWASLVTYGALDDGAPVLCLSHLAEHGRNLAGDRARAS
jgi:Pyridoxamine 5'-phosphate oxidase